MPKLCRLRAQPLLVSTEEVSGKKPYSEFVSRHVRVASDTSPGAKDSYFLADTSDNNGETGWSQFGNGSGSGPWV